VRLQALAALARTNEHCTTFEQRAPDPAAIHLDEAHAAAGPRQFFLALPMDDRVGRIGSMANDVDLAAIDAQFAFRRFQQVSERASVVTSWCRASSIQRVSGARNPAPSHS